METRKVSSEKLIECIHGLDTNEVSNVSACMRLANEHIDAIDIASLFMEESATITLKQAELIIGIRKAFNFICDEYDKFVSKTDGEFFSLSREAKCINIVSTQSYSSLKNALKDENSVKVIIQNLINKIWFRTDDIFTIEESQKQLGKEEKEKTSKSISESAKETTFSYITNSLNSQNSNISETFSTYTQNDFIYDLNFFTQNLETFTALTFLSDGNKIFTPRKLNMFPYFEIDGL